MPPKLLLVYTSLRRCGRASCSRAELGASRAAVGSFPLSCARWQAVSLLNILAKAHRHSSASATSSFSGRIQASRAGRDGFYSGRDVRRCTLGRLHPPALPTPHLARHALGAERKIPVGAACCEREGACACYPYALTAVRAPQQGTQQGVVVSDDVLMHAWKVLNPEGKARQSPKHGYGDAVGVGCWS